ncbi:HNH endonuclease [Tsuneonella troitsensis]|uniref:HNH endonuclease n=1 Tax=Tsuneonella troitsensis TaxID=292222 RepID=UPI000710B03B|nr:HNH endonuclease signature motif containing protein [Tsuneonella troitsensis]
MPQIDDLIPGDELTNGDLAATFRVGNMGGMRRSLETNTLVIVSDPFKGLYIDRWVGDVLHYTGMGKSGDQSLSFMQNKTLAESPTNGVAVHLFEVHKPSVYSYFGEVKLASAPYQDTQKGEDGVSRKVWIFPVAPKVENAVPISVEALRAEAEAQAKQARALNDSALRARAIQSGTAKVGTRTATTQQYQRNPWVAEYALRRAGGSCDLCKRPAPFMKRPGEPYLEVHHIEWLSKGGADTIENTVALCPNCHRKMHVVQSADDVDFLTVAATQ